MMRFILSATLVLGMGSVAVAGELDNESGVINKQLQGTMVLRVDNRTGEAAFTHTEAAMATTTEAVAFVKSADFKAVPSSKLKSELDSDGGASSWYFYYGLGYYNPYCNWYGSYYSPYYAYNYGYYNYYYYGAGWSYYR